jgi:hypothetical protein
MPHDSVNFAGQIHAEDQWPKDEDYILTGLRKNEIRRMASF